MGDMQNVVNNPSDSLSEPAEQRQEEDGVANNGAKVVDDNTNVTNDKIANRDKDASYSEALETVLTHAGDMGRYQKILFFAMLPFGLFYGYVYFVQMFIAATPQDHWCRIPELEHLPMEIRRQLSAPLLANGLDWERCFTYDANWTQVLETMLPPAEDTPLIPCRHGWEFDLTDIPYATVVSERGWVCDNAGYEPIAQSIFFVGSLLGSLFFGWFADKFGRIPALIGANLIGAVGGIATIFTNGVWDFILCRFIAGLSLDSAFMMMYILVLEYVGVRYRTVVANMSYALYFGAGCMSLPWLALWLNDWRMLLWVTSTPMFLVVFVPFIIPESARWLISRGRIDKAVNVLRKIEKVNGTKIPDEVLDEFIELAKENKESDEHLVKVLIKSPPLRITMLLIILVFMSCCILFDGLARISAVIGTNFFIQFTLSSATELPSIALLVLVLDRWGRRLLTAGPMALGGASLLIAMFVPEGIPQAAIAIIARFFINMCYNAIIQWVTELLPTPVRASGSSTMHMSGYAAIMTSPYIIYSERVWHNLPLLIMGVIGLAGAGLSLVLPETKGRPMPQTTADGEKIVREGKRRET